MTGVRSATDSVRAGEQVSQARVLVLGALAVEFAGTPVHVAGTHRRRLLALLASRPGHAVSVDAIVDALWGEDPPRSAAKTIQSHVMRLRRSLAEVGGDVLETVPGGYYRLNVEPAAVDAVRFEQLAADGRRELGRGNAASAVGSFREALRLWRGPAYAEFRDAEFALAEGARLSELRSAAVEDLGEAQLAIGAVATVVADLERLVVEEPGRERAWALLMQALYAAGRQQHALAAFRRARQALVEGFGIEPGGELRVLEQRILDQDPTLPVAGDRSTLPPALRVTSPFVGRDAELAALRQAWAAAVSGSGCAVVLLGAVDSGRTRLAAELAAGVFDDGGRIEYVRGADGFGSLLGDGVAAPLPGVVVDSVTDRCRRGPLLLVVDDAEWMPSAAVAAVEAVVDTAARLPILVLLIADPSGGGPAVGALRRLQNTVTSRLLPLVDEIIGRIVVSDSVAAAEAGPIVAMARGLPGAARREAAAWAERVASDRLHAAAASAIGALSASDEARASMFDEVVHLVTARARRSELVSSSWAGRQPYRALASYGPEDADLFAGRERSVAELAARVLDRRLVAVVGASGSGKSSLVRAGLIPLVRSGRLPGGPPWRTHVVVPGRDPLAALDGVADLDDPGTQLLVVDQFEEALASDQAAAFAGRLVDLVLDAALDVHVVIVVRADQYATLATTHRLAELFDDAQVLVGPPTDEELRRIIEVPAQRTGCVVEPALVTRITDDVAGHDALPLVSAALAEVWERRDGDTLRAERYVEIGGIAAAVERLGTKAIERACDATAIRDVMLRLVDVTDDGEWVRRRIAADEFPAAWAAAVDALVEQRLVVRDGDTVDVVHEVVFRAWPQLVAWLEEAREDLVLDRDLRAGARRWDAEGRTDDDVLRGARLAAAAEFTARHGDVPTEVTEFVAAGRRVADREHEQIRDQLAREVRSRRRLGRAFVTAAVLLVLAVVGGMLALAAQRRADDAAERGEDERRQAQVAGTLAEARRIGTQALVEDDYDQALLLAVEGRHLEDSPETRQNLLATIQRSPDAIAVIRSETEAILDLALTPDGKTLLASGTGDVPSLSKYDVTTRNLEASIPGAGATSSAVSPDGSLAAMSFNTGAHGERTFELHIVDMTTFDVIGTLSGLVEAPPTRLSFSPDGRYIGAVTDSDLSGAGVIDAFALVWDLERGGRPVVQYPFSAPNFQRDAAFLPDSKRILVAGADGTAIVDIASGRKVGQIDGAHPPIAISRDGTMLAAATDLTPGVVIGLFDVTSGQRSAVLAGHQERLVRLAFSADGTKLASGADDRLVIVWDVASGQRAAVYEGHGAGVKALTFNPDGTTLWSGGDDRAIFAWDLQHADTLVHQPSPAVADAPPLPFTAQGMVIGPGGRDVVFPSTEQVPFQTRNVDTGALGRPMDEVFLSFSLDGNRYLTVGEDERLRAWDQDTGAVLAVSEGSGFSGFHEGLAVFTPDGRHVVAIRYDASGGLDNDNLVVLDASTLAPIGGEPVPVRSTGRMVSVTPDGRHAVVVVSGIEQPGTKVLLVDLETRHIVRSTPVEPGGQPFIGARNNSVAPDGRTVGIGGVLGDVVVVDAVTGKVSQRLYAHDGFVESVTFAPDYASFVTTGQDGAVKLWDAKTQQLLASVLPLGPNHRVRASFLAADRVLIVYDTGEIFEWDPRPDAWEAYACKVAGRNLTETEWDELFPGQAYRVTCPDFTAGE